MQNAKLMYKKKLIVKEIKNKISLKELDIISDLIKKENFESILSNLNKKIIKTYIKIAVNYNDAFLFVLLKNNLIIGYALYFKKETDIFKKFKLIKFDVFINLFFGFKILALLNISLAITKLDYIFMIFKKKKIKNYVNLNLLAIKNKYQSKGYGKYLIEYSVKKIRKNIRINKIICEAPSQRVLKFYLKNNFYIIGKKIRLFRLFYILQKRI